MQAAALTMGWLGHLELEHQRRDARTVALDRHTGPLRVLRSLYPEGDEVCHQVLVHPPGGIVGGDELRLDLNLREGTHALITTPGATRFYRSDGPLAQQRVQARVADGARLEWLPLETIAYRRCRAGNHLRFELAPTAQMIGWDLLALGLPAAGEAFDEGQMLQELELPGLWLERGVFDGADALLMQSPLGLAGHEVCATLWLADGQPLARERREALLDVARQLADASPLAARSGATSPDEGLVLLRVLAPRVEPAFALLQAVWGAWRQLHWQRAPCAPRVWRT